MHATRNRVGLLLAMAMVMSGCSGLRAPATFEYFHDPDIDPFQEHVWPQPPEKPRLRYLGSLVGEPNFPRKSSSQLLSSGQNFLKKLVGLNAKHHHQIILQRPQSGVVDSQGNILVTDVSRQAVYRFSPASRTLNVWEYAAKDLRFVSPIGVAVDGRDQVWVADSRLGFVVQL
ncbi:MAG: 6-bladed beta-propeller, partial [Gammaproteobacteria bacterium]